MEGEREEGEGAKGEKRYLLKRRIDLVLCDSPQEVRR